MGYGVRAPKVSIPGTNLAGRVEAVGKDVTRFTPGDEVFGTGTGAFAEYACAREGQAASKPTNITLEQAAVVPHGGYTALQGLRDQGRVAPGHKVLIIGASGAVGSIAVPLAKASGAEVTGVCSTTKVDMVHALGADRVIDYTRDDFVDAGSRYDVILDNAGDTPIARLRQVLTARGRLVIVGGEGGGRWVGVGRQIRAVLLSPFVSQKLRMFVAKENLGDLTILKQHIEAGTVTPTIARTYPLGDAADAIRHLERGDARGRIAVTI